MMDMMLNLAESPSAPWIVLAGAALIILVEAARHSRALLWGDLIGDDFDD